MKESTECPFSEIPYYGALANLHKLDSTPGSFFHTKNIQKEGKFKLI